MNFPDRSTFSSFPDSLAATQMFPAEAADIPIADDDSLVVRREGNHTIVDGSYVQSAELFPGYPHTFPFTIHLDVPTSTLP